MIQLIYLIITIYFAIGAIGFFIINRKKEANIARKSWLKFITYFIIINLLFFSITIDTHYFKIVSFIIFIIGFGELWYVSRQGKQKHPTSLIQAYSTLLAAGIAYLNFSTADKHFLLYSFLLLSIFDSFSQISGQLFGKNKIAPKISPQKTYGGLIGGTICTIISAFVLKGLYPMDVATTMLTALLICLSAFGGDIAASFYKRQFGVKDYSQLVPGHGGILDRFDSLIGVGAALGIAMLFIGTF